MKKFLIPILFAALALSCGEKDGTSTDNDVPGELEIAEFIVEDMTISEDGDPVDIPVKTNPEKAILSEHARVSVEQGEDLIEYSVRAHSIYVTPKAKGKVVFVLAPKYGPGEVKRLNLTIGASLVSIKITSPKTITDKTITISSKETVQLGTIIKNSESQTVNTPVNWTLLSGSEYVSLSSDGLLSGVNGGGSAVVRASIAQKSSIYDELNVVVEHAPENLVISSGDKDLNVLSGGALSFNVRVEPAKAIQQLSITLPSGSSTYFTMDQTELTGSSYTWQITIKGKQSSPKAHEIRIATADQTIEKILKLYINDYNDMTPKPGDYVYYAASKENSASSPFILYDCGRRCQDRFEGGAKKARPNNSGEVFIGILATVGKPSDDFLGNNIYKTSSMISASSLAGCVFNNKTIHGLVIASTPCDNKVGFCPENETCSANSSIANTYSGFSTNKYGYARYYAIRDVYNTNSLYKPVAIIPEVESYNAAHNVGNRTTKWFVPGKADIQFITDAYSALSLDDPSLISSPRYCITDYNGYYMDDWRLSLKDGSYIVFLNYTGKKVATASVWPVMWL